MTKTENNCIVLYCPCPEQAMANIRSRLNFRGQKGIPKHGYWLFCKRHNNVTPAGHLNKLCRLTNYQSFTLNNWMLIGASITKYFWPVYGMEDRTKLNLFYEGLCCAKHSRCCVKLVHGDCITRGPT